MTTHVLEPFESLVFTLNGCEVVLFCMVDDEGRIYLNENLPPSVYVAHRKRRGIPELLFPQPSLFDSYVGG